MKNWINQCHIGDCREVMKHMVEDGVKVQCCVTSPPYYGLRDYGIDSQIGLEKTPVEYIETMRETFSLVRQILNDDGTCWIVIGDSYAGSGGAHKEHHANPGLSKSFQRRGVPHWGDLGQPSSYLPPKGLKPKNLIGIPWSVAFALRDDGWYLRSEIIWHKQSCLPESVKDRPTKAHETIFLLSKNQRYYYDYETILELANYDGRKDTIMKGSDKYRDAVVPDQAGQSFASRGQERWREDEDGNKMRNKRSVWTINPEPYKEAHFATFPPKLIEPMILAGSRVGDIVFDPFLGSGTTAQVAQKLGRNWIGIELNPDYERLIKERASQGGLQLQ